MKHRIVLLLFLILSCPLLFAELPTECSIDLLLKSSGESRIDIGFASGEVTETTSQISSINSIYLTSQKYEEGDDFIKAVNPNIWIYWCSVSNDDLKVTLDILDGNGLSASGEDSIDWRVVEYSDEQSETYKIYASTFQQEISQIVPFEHEKSGIKDIGSQRISIEAEIPFDNFLNYSITTYSGTLKVEVTTK